MTEQKQLQSDLFRLHPKQWSAFESQNKITLCASGIQAGKTTVGALWALSKCFDQPKDFCGIIGAPTYKILNQSTIPTWLKYASRFGYYNKADQEFIFPDGFKVYLRTSTDPDSIEGIRNVRWFWMDEAGKCKLQFWINAEGRAARTNAPLFLTTTPYGMNWPYQLLIKPFKEGSRPDVSYYEWLSIDNPAFPVDEYERQKKILDPKIFRRKYMGIHERMEGLVYELSNDNEIKSTELPKHTRYFASVDWGFTEGHEFAILVRAITLDGWVYEVDEFKASGVDPAQQIQICRAKLSTYGIEMFYCDPARPDMIFMLNKENIPAMGFHTGKESFKQLMPGINKHYELIKSGKYRIFTDRCIELIEEYETYHWPEYKTDQKTEETPIKVNDHLMDCARMMTVGTMNIVVKEQPKPFMSQKLPQRDYWDPKKTRKKILHWDSY